MNNDTIQPINVKNKIISASLVNPHYTPNLESNVTEYNLLGWKVFGAFVQGYFVYNHKSVQPYHTNSWYEKNMNFNLWQVSNWEKGVHMISNNTAEVYSKGNFHYGFEYNDNSLTVQNYSVKVYLICDQNGNYGAHYSITKLIPKLKIGSLNIEF